MLYEKLIKCFDEADIGTFISLMHEDFQWTRHSDGGVVTPENMNTDWFVDLMVNTHFEERRCLYENDEVLVMHEIATFPSGNRDATLSVFTKKDGVFWRLENGSTPLPPKE